MSSYLNFYLVPKKREGAKEDPKPLNFISYSRSTDIYRSYYEVLNPVFIGTEEEYEYTELTPLDAKRVIDDAKKDLQDTINRFESKKRAYKELSNTPIPEEAIAEFMDTEEYIRELKENVQSLESIYEWVSDIEYSDFEKVLINID